MNNYFRKISLALTTLVILSFSILPSSSNTGKAVMGSDQKDGKLFRDENGQLFIYDKRLNKTLPVNDVRDKVSKTTKERPLDKAGVKAFLISKKKLILSNQNLSAEEKKRGIEKIKKALSNIGEDDEDDSEDETPPVPGGLGVGVSYNSDFKSAFTEGTMLDHFILCPTKAGGNVSTYLYLTAMNRAAKCVEAFVSYLGQDDFEFKVFDWAREDHWQVALPYYTLSDYLTTKTVGGNSYQALHVFNQTYDWTGNGTVWVNNVFLTNYRTGQADWIYHYVYSASLAEQRGSFGWWGPIIETFQGQYSNINHMGFAEALIFTVEEWGYIDYISDSVSTFSINTGLGFQLINLQPNHTFTAH